MFWTTWPEDAKLRLLAAARARLWLEQARPEQLPPPGDWRSWYVQGGRGAGKTRTGAETLATWIHENDPGEWGVIAPTFGDAKLKCIEGKRSGLIRVLGGYHGLVKTWNRSEGVLELKNGSIIYVDGANDGAFRIQGYNLRGVWADEVGLWEKWDEAWNQSIRPAIREEPGLIIATGTPKMGHQLVEYLIESPRVAVTLMKTIDNVENLDPGTVQDLYAEYAGSTLGRQELDGEYIAALEGSILRRTDWRWYPKESSFYGRDVTNEWTRALPRFDLIAHSWDTALKDKTSSDFAAGQVWGVKGPDRYLLRVWHGHAGLNATLEAMRELRAWSGALWPRVPQFVLIEATANGPDAITEMRREVDGVTSIAAKGDKVQRALSAAVALETGHCYLPGSEDVTASGRGYGADTPPEVQAFVEECAMFRGDMRHSHDDQVDAWSQMVNWTRQRKIASAKLGRPQGRVPRIGAIAT